MADSFCEHVRFQGVRGGISAELNYALSAARGAALLIAPHPYMGGRMDNPLLVQIAEALSGQDLVSMRFDFGGVGDSEGAALDISASMAQFWSTGEAPEDADLIEEARAAHDWLSSRVPGPVSLIGYSFGAFAAASIVNSMTPSMTLIAPTIGQHQFDELESHAVPTLVVHGDDDFATTRVELESWIDGLSGPTTLCSFPGAGHFFRGFESSIAARCSDFMTIAHCAAMEATG